MNATLISDHSADSRLDDVDAAARERRRDLYDEYRSALAAIDRDKLTSANQIDAEILHNEIESGLWSLDTLQEWTWSPLVYVRLSGSAIYVLVARDFAPIETRLISAASRLEQLPRYLEQARGSLQAERVPKIHAETAMQHNKGLLSIIEFMIVRPAPCLRPPSTRKVALAVEHVDCIAKYAVWQYPKTAELTRRPDARLSQAGYFVRRTRASLLMFSILIR